MKFGIYECKELILGSIDQIKNTEKLSIDESLGRVLAEPVVSENEYPKQDVSRFDGYVLKGQDLKEGDNFKIVNKNVLKNGECKRVGTGKKIPENTDLVVKVEDVSKKDGFITIDRRPKAKNIFKKGSNIKKGQIILEPENEVDEVSIGIFPTIEKESVRVYESTKVGIVATGDEITPTNDVNSRVLSGLITRNGGKLEALKRVRDVESNIKKTILDMVNSNFDLIITVGGTSKGEKDFVIKVISDLGEIKFNGVKMRPGKTFTFGEVDGVPIFSLSGTVTPCLIQAYLYLRPALRYANHLPEIAMESFYSKRNISAETHKLLSKGAFKALPAKIEEGNKIEPVFGKYTTILPFLSSDCIMIIGEEKDQVRKDEEIKALPLY